MAWFSRDKKPEETKPEIQEVLEFPFEVLWKDEEPSGLLAIALPIVQIILLLYIAVVVHGLK